MLLAIWDDGVWQDAARIAVIALIAYGLVLWIGALVWTYRDASSRTRDPFTQAMALLLVLVFNLPGLLLYLILRPKDTLVDAYDRQLEAEALLHEIQEQATCPSCRRKIESDFVACPFCRTTLRTPCEACGKPMAATWVLCPFCATERSGAPTSLAGRGTAAPAPASRERGTEPTQMQRPKRASTATYTPPAAPVVPVSQPDTGIDAGS